ncbi:MAG: aldehyde ferredoxin oxidoreductase N-terminal domain-containing protein [Actinomycetota bacterium]
MAKGYVGKILYVNLTDKTTEEIATADYQQFGGGHGIGAAIFWDRVKDKTIDGFHPDNLVSFMTSPISGTGAPSASGRTEITGFGVQQYPIGWFTRSNFGGRWSAMIKYAGYDGVVVQGKSETPVWINIVNGKVTIEDATDLWGLDTHETQEEIWKTVTGNVDVRDWWDAGTIRDGGRTTAKPAVVCIGPAGENLVRSAIVLHDAGNGGGQGGFGAVLGSKNLKAISCIGTGSVEVADPADLMDIRMEMKEKFGFNVDDPKFEAPVPGVPMYGIMTNAPGYATLLWAPQVPARAQGCHGCFKNCRCNLEGGNGNGDICVEGLYWMANGVQADHLKATDLLDRLGLNVYDVMGHSNILALVKMGIAGPGMAIDTEDIPFDKYDTYEFIEKYTEAIAYRKGTFGDTLAEGLTRAWVKWGRYEEDTNTGLLNRPQWGFAEHYDPRLEVEWSYGSLFGDRDINEHGVNWHAHWMPLVTAAVGQAPLMSAEELVTHFAEATGVGDPDGWDYSAEGIYADPKLKAVAWHRHYGRFWLQSMLFCDWAWPHLVGYNEEGGVGATPDYEVRIYKAVTGEDLSYEDSLEIGRKIWNLDRAIWALQGRTREMEVFTNYVYDVATSAPYFLPVKENGEWSYGICLDRKLDREKFEGVKDRFYALEGWDVKTGWPTRAGLSELGLDYVADELEKNGKLGA